LRRHGAAGCSLAALDQSDYIALWRGMPADSQVDEVVRNFFIRQPVLWLH
jgi:hypothetical protein